VATAQAPGGMRGDAVFAACIALIVACLIVSAVVASKLSVVAVAGLAVVVPVGTALYALTFAAADVLAEVWGTRHAAVGIVAGLAMRLLAVAFLGYAVAVDPVAGWQGQEAYAAVLQSSEHILWAGIVAYAVSQPLNVLLFQAMKRRQAGRNLLWLRNNVSTFLAQGVDTALFVLLAFGAGPEVAPILVGQIAVKWAIALADTPFVYLARNIATGRRLLDVTG